MGRRQGRSRGTLVAVMLGALIIFSGPITGCTMKAYTGPELPDEQVAKITTPSARYYLFWASNVTLVAVDGQRGGIYTKNARMLSGRHTIDVQYSEGAGCAGGQALMNATLTLDVEAGRVYEINSNFTHVWAIDKSTGEVIAGLKPKN